MVTSRLTVADPCPAMDSGLGEATGDGLAFGDAVAVVPVLPREASDRKRAPRVTEMTPVQTRYCFQSLIMCAAS
jgi:hypothetical protein